MVASMLLIAPMAFPVLKWFMVVAAHSA